MMTIKLGVGGLTSDIISAQEAGLDDEDKKCFWEDLDKVGEGGVLHTEEILMDLSGQLKWDMKMCREVFVSGT